MTGQYPARLKLTDFIAGQNRAWAKLRVPNWQKGLLHEHTTLAEALFAQGVLPYYLHLPDRVQGTAHFYVDAKRAKALHQQMQARLPGYLVPRLAQEVPEQPNKVLL